MGQKVNVYGVEGERIWGKVKVYGVLWFFIDSLKLIKINSIRGLLCISLG